MKKHIPNFITCLNLLCGCIALVEMFSGSIAEACYIIFIAAFLDLLDGLMARWLNAHSEIGKQLDSLADIVSFGVVPGAVMFAILRQNTFDPFPDQGTLIYTIIQFIPFSITIFSALRLAKFNVDTRQTTSFIGLPTPANTLLIVSFPLIIMQRNESWNAVLLNPYFVLGSSILLSYLLVCELPMFSLKMKTFAFNANKIQYIFLALSVILFVIFFIKAIPLIIILYILLSLIKAGSGKREAGS